MPIKALVSLFTRGKAESKVITGAIQTIFSAKASGGWNMIVLVNPWKDEKGVLHEEDLRLASERRVSRADIESETSRLVQGTTWRFKIVEHATWFELVQIDGPVQDPALDRREETPTLIQDEILGSLCLNRKLSCYEGSWPFNGKPCTLHIPRSEKDPKVDILRARSLLPKLEKNVGQLQSAIAPLAGLYNDTWRQEDGEPLAQDEFLERIVLQLIVVHPSDVLALYYDGAGLFMDHSIQVQIDSTGQILGVDIA